MKISTPQEIAVKTHFHAQHGNKTTPSFLPADGEANWVLLPGLVSLLSGGTGATTKHLFLYPQGDRSGLRNPKKDKPQH